MNTKFIAIIRRIVAEQGEGILGDPQRLKSFIKNYAQNEPKETRLTFGRCVEAGAYTRLKNTRTDAERRRVKRALLSETQAASGLGAAQCNDALEVILAVLYGEHPAKPRQKPRFHPPVFFCTIHKKGAIAVFVSAAVIAAFVAVFSARNGAPEKTANEPGGSNGSGGPGGEYQYEAGGFEEALQWLTVEIACLGKYSSVQTGNYTLQAPHDYYTPEFISQYLAGKSGRRTMTKMIYGVCFDYAQLCWEELLESKTYYQDLGMTDWWIVGVDDNSDVLTLYDPTADPQRADFRSNGVMLKTIRREQARAHGGASYHAWIWVKEKSSRIYWIDPTWTDNTGKVVWGYVDNGREIELPPAKDLCVESGGEQ